ncbi:hypothetical protein KSD_90990 [Ktedonobacter sp. SOSP1-85]|nr:hypothetical protein KSD_90990 [Ktedonobacter sp. SOSP1-85]
MMRRSRAHVEMLEKRSILVTNTFKQVRPSSSAWELPIMALIIFPTLTNSMYGGVPFSAILPLGMGATFVLEHDFPWVA